MKNKVEKLFIDRAVKYSGSIILLSKDDAIEFIKECNKSKIVILGIDGFFVTDTTTQPSLDNSIDFSSESYIPKIQNVYEAAMEFVKAKNDNLHFEIVCGN